jgi:hypothetical protein
MRIDEVLDLEARFIRYGGQERLGVTCGDEQRVNDARLLKAAPRS